jgi:phosphatidylserine/phosphatidylglycerophosphate/cardiolipin synthase-like enzyme
VITADGGHARAFVLPDGAGVVDDTLAGADDRLLLAGYTLTSRRVADRLLAAERRGANVSVLLDGDPVDGISRRQASILDDLVAAGIEVRLLTGEAARYDYHHPKYAVVDDRALVSTENFKPAGTGGNSSRGWGVVVNRSSVVAGLAETFAADSGARDAKPWQTVREGRTFASAPTTDGEYPTRFPAETVAVEQTTLLVAPDNARSAVVDTIDDADESLRVVQMSIDDRDGPFVTAAIRAARRGVEVRILLSSAWYVRDHNDRMAEWLTDVAERDDLPLEARLADPNGRYGKIHAKGMIVDGRTVVLGSLNWNREATTNNREVLIAMTGDEVGAYYAAVFDADWRGGSRGLPVGLLGAAVGCVLLAGLVYRRIDFE